MNNNVSEIHEKYQNFRTSMFNITCMLTWHAGGFDHYSYDSSNELVGSVHMSSMSNCTQASDAFARYRCCLSGLNEYAVYVDACICTYTPTVCRVGTSELTTF